MRVSSSSSSSSSRRSKKKAPAVAIVCPSLSRKTIRALLHRAPQFEAIKYTHGGRQTNLRLPREAGTDERPQAEKNGAPSGGAAAEPSVVVGPIGARFFFLSSSSLSFFRVALNATCL